MSDLLREAQDPSTPAARLPEIAQADRGTWVALASHPNAYPGLLDWLGEHGDDAVRAAIEARNTPLPPPPAAPVAPPAPPASAVSEPAEGEPAATDASSAEPAAPMSSATGADAEVTQPIFTSSAQSADPEPTQQFVAPETTQFASPVPSETNPSDGSGSAGSGKNNLVKVLAVLVAIAVIVGGIWFAVDALTGDDDDEAASLPASANSATPDITIPTPPSITMPTPPSIGSEPGGEAPSASGDSAEFCAAMQSVSEEGMDSLSSGMSEGNMSDTLTKLGRLYQNLEDASPSEIKSDVAVMSKFLSDAMSGKIPEDMQGYLEASRKVSSFYVQNCF